MAVHILANFSLPVTSSSLEKVQLFYKLHHAILHTFQLFQEAYSIQLAACWTQSMMGISMINEAGQHVGVWDLSFHVASELDLITIV